MLSSDVESLDSARDFCDRVTPKNPHSHARSMPETLAGPIRERPMASGGPWRSSLLKWNALQPKDVEETRPGAEEVLVDDSLVYRTTLQTSESVSEGELQLCDPKSWVWRRNKDAKFAIAIDATKNIIPDVSRLREYISETIGLTGERTYRAPEKPKEMLWLDRVEIPLLSPQKADLLRPGPLKQTSINKFSGDRTTMASLRAKPPPSGTLKVSGPDASIASIKGKRCSHKSVSLSSIGDDETTANYSHHNKSNSLSSTPATSAGNTPEPPVSDNGRARLSRTAKKKLPASLIANALNSSDLDMSSVSDYVTSSDQLDVVTESESATDCQPTEDTASDYDDQVILPAAKRIKSNHSLQASKRTLATSILEDFVDEEDAGDHIDGLKAKKSGKNKTAEDFQYKDTFVYKVGVNETLRPIYEIQDIFGDITNKARELGLDNVIGYLDGRKLKIATMCSGTESPLLAFQLVSNSLKKQRISFEFEHMFSAEIVPYKQAYIERNFPFGLILRDITELSNPDAVNATTAYGGLAPIPGDLDIVIAGFACVDFSNLNNEKKTINAGGESGDTFAAIRDYANKYRPKIIILENVVGAPWKAIQDIAMPQIGYAATFLKVDTKNYYIPHTRVRGYMICVDARSYHDPDGKCHVLKDEKVLKSILSTWATTLKAFQRPASCPVEAFLLEEDDPRAIRGREELANSGRGDSRRTKEIDWARCHGRHQDIRAAMFLGQKRPLTKWEDGGSCKVPDYMWQAWALGQVERVLDTIDISWLRNLNRGYDHQYKFRLLELSQNVDRVKDNMGSGLAGCITPTGIPFSTTRGGPLIGLEALALQGLPIDKLQLTRERQSQLQDLAGNAMSSTVVGPAILAALIAGYRTLPRGQSTQMDTDMPSSLSKHDGEHHLVPHHLDLAAYDPVSVATVLDMADKTIRLCLCEGREMVTISALQQCSLCKHTTCVKCGGNPSHKYARLKPELISQRMPPAEFQDFIKKALPMKIMFSNVSKAALQDLEPKYRNSIDFRSWNATINASSNAFGSVLHFRAAKRSEIWTIYYDSEYASMQLVLSHGKAEWRLYGKPSSTEPVNSDIRQLLSRPIARMQPTGADIVNGLWQVWLPKVYQFDVTMHGGGALTRSFENIQGIGKFADAEVWEQYTISTPSEASRLLDVDISGTYKLLQDCGTAMGSLHIQSKSATSSTPLSLFLDPDRIHHPKDDKFVFSLDKRRLNYGESRLAVARVNASWRPQKLEKVGENSSNGEENYRIDGSKKLVTLHEAQLPVQVKCSVDGQWVNLPGTKFDSPRDKAATIHRAPPTLSISSSADSCQVAHVVLSCAASMPANEHSPWQVDDWVEVSLMEYKAFFADFAWLTQKASTLPGLEKWKKVPNPPSTHCQMCAPTAPGIKWRLEAPKTSKKKADATKPVAAKKEQPSKLVAFEDPEQASTFERSLKNRPSPLVTQIHIDDAGLVKLRIAVNPETLIHRALAKLLPSHDGSRTSTSWRLCTNQVSPPKVNLPAFTLKNNDHDPSAVKPPGFLHDLRPEQSRSLTWMIRQESDEVEAFIEEEVEEASIAQIGWRAEGRARKPVLVRGGVLADQVGYGKTVTTLGLIDSQHSHDREAATIPLNGRISLHATLIVVPPQLPDQWNREIKKFLDRSRAYTVLIIKNIATLQKMTIAEFQSADIIIISWNVCDGDNYLFNLAQFAGMVELPKKTTKRAAAAWYEHALNEICEHVDDLKGGGRELQKLLDRKLASSKDKAVSEETFVPSKRLRGQAYQKAKQGPATGTKRAHATAFSDDYDADPMETDRAQIETLKLRPDVFGLRRIATGQKGWTAMTCPLLELFEFSRIVVDEYTYVIGQESLTVPKLKAKSRWMLSATPPLRDFVDVKCISKFLGINLGIDDLTPGVIKAANIKALEKERTDYEQFQSFKPSQSAAWHEHRHGVAQRFLDQFVRQNIADIEAIKGCTHMMPIILPAAERAIYLELNQLLAGNEFSMKKGKSNADNDRARRIRDILGKSESAGEALMKCASHFTLDDLNKKLENAPKACDIIVKLRQSQYEALKVDFKQKLKQAEWLEKACSSHVRQYPLWKSHINSNQFGDSGSMKEIAAMIEAAETGYDKNHWIEFYVTPKQKAELENAANAAKIKKNKSSIRKKYRGKKAVKRIGSEGDFTIDEDSEFAEDDLDYEADLGSSLKRDTRRLKPDGVDDHKNMERAFLALRDVTNDLRKLSTELVNRCRCLRFFECARNLQKLYSSLRGNEPLSCGCSCSNCGTTNLSPKAVSILSQCGHTICSNCLDFHKDRQDECLVLGCNAVNKTYQVIKAHELGVEDDRTRIGRHYGKKLEDIVQLIKKIPKDDQVLLFVQFVDLMNTITSALKENGITYSVLGESGDASKELTEFQTNFNTATKKQVLVLNIGDASAAGSNLTNANHVIFISPFLTESQQTYDQAMTQAMGRARRYGQTKPVHIYYFLSLKTIDVDTLQLRSGKNLAENVGPPPEFIPFGSFVPSSFGLVSSKLGENGEFGSAETSKLLMEEDDA